MSSPRSNRGRHCLIAVISLCLPAILFFCVRAEIRPVTEASNMNSNLRQIGQAVLIHIQQEGKSPRAQNIWDYARKLAEITGLDSGSMWQSRLDPAQSNFDPQLPVLIGQQSRQLNPAFLKIRPCFAVSLAEIDAKMPQTVPLAWARGLKSDGTWSEHSPFGNEGGSITFLGGGTFFYRNLSDDGGQLVRFDGKGPTANILEALPPGTQISEYIPTAAEEKKWARINWQRAMLRKATNVWSVSLLFIAIIFTPVFGFSEYAQKISTRLLMIVTSFFVLLTVALASV